MYLDQVLYSNRKLRDGSSLIAMSNPVTAAFNKVFCVQGEGEVGMVKGYSRLNTTIKKHRTHSNVTHGKMDYIMRKEKDLLSYHILTDDLNTEYASIDDI